LRVEDFAQLVKAATTCSERGAAAFGDPRVYLERYLQRPRHIEVQILCAGKGRGWALGERECSVQRRHQKLIEECPSPARFFDEPGARQRLWQAALELVSSQPYVGLATVEFIVDGSGIPYFLEVNPRLQVEHGITELVRNIDLVELQLRVASGESLTLPEELPAQGHAIEVRLYAEDPERGFMPQPGELEEFSFPATDASFRVDTGFRAGDTITPYYDPLLAKVMAHGATRELAIERLLTGLGQTRIALRGKTGAKRTNLPLMVRVAGGDAFRSGEYTTHLLEESP
ncbi:MAG: hypothetical protein RL033_6862, partial [Pseudomonadota bacterium]